MNPDFIPMFSKSIRMFYYFGPIKEPWWVPLLLLWWKIERTVKTCPIL